MTTTIRLFISDFLAKFAFYSQKSQIFVYSHTLRKTGVTYFVSIYLLQSTRVTEDGRTAKTELAFVRAVKTAS